MVDFVTCLNIDQRAPVRLVAGEDSVKLDCHGTEIEMFIDSLEQLLSCVEQACPASPVAHGSGRSAIMQ